MSKESAYFRIENLDKHGIKQIKSNIDALPGVISVSANSEDGKIAVDFDNTGVTFNKIKNNLSDMGYQIMAEDDKKHTM